MDNYNIKKNSVAKNIKTINQVWVRKDLLEAQQKTKGPKQIWIPKLTSDLFAGKRERKQPIVSRKWLLKTYDQ